MDLGAGLLEPALHLVEQPFAACEKGVPGLGERDAARAAQQQLRAQQFLQPRELPAQGGLGDAGEALRLRQAAAAGDQHESLDQGEIDAAHAAQRCRNEKQRLFM